eukprot:8773280-Ditylum_brightwellii.AAC.1
MEHNKEKNMFCGSNPLIRTVQYCGGDKQGNMRPTALVCTMSQQRLESKLLHVQDHIKLTHNRATVLV